MDRDIAASARRALVNAVGGGVLSELSATGVPAILLKGASTARWLYPDLRGRSYTDVDVLVPDDLIEASEAVLRQLGFDYAYGDTHSRTWVRRDDDARVDLHWTIVGVGTPPADTFALLAEQTEEMRLGDAAVRVLSREACALHVALHAAQHGVRETRSVEDVRRAVERFSVEEWDRATVLATRLGARTSLAAGLRLVPSGVVLADELGLPRGTSLVVAVRSETPPPVTEGLIRLAQTPGLGRRMRVVADAILPPPAYVRTYSTLARRGRLGLAAAYVERLVQLSWRLVPATRALLRARRSVANQSDARRTSEPPRNDRIGT